MKMKSVDVKKSNKAMNTKKSYKATNVKQNYKAMNVMKNHKNSGKENYNAKKKNCNNGLKNRKVLFATIICCVIVFSVIVICLLQAKPADSDIVALIENEPVTVKEFRHYILEERGAVIEYFRNKYGVQDDPDFWSSSYNGENPSEVVKRNAINEIKRTKVQLLMAQKEGIIENISYESLLREMEKENKKRKEAIEKKQIIFGLKEYDPRTYLFYKMAELSKELKSRLLAKLNVSDEQIRDYYEQVKDIYYTQGKRVKTKIIKLSYADEDGKVRAEMKDDLRDKCDEIKKRINDGESFEKIIEELNISDDDSERIFDNKTASVDARLNPVLREIVMGMDAGEISDVIEEGNAFYIVKCLESIVLSYKPFDEVKENLRARYIDDKYSEYIDKLVEEANVLIYDNVYKKVRTDR
ncbi:MAG TPA: hypothetical protein GXX36_11555 [Clostridiaceae bacterium]|nr:hypothetical protein [Clostridiaceae bacterium]